MCAGFSSPNNVSDCEPIRDSVNVQPTGFGVKRFHPHKLWLHAAAASQVPSSWSKTDHGVLKQTHTGVSPIGPPITWALASRR